MTNCKCSKQKLTFQKTPKANTWIVADGEKILFEETVCLGECRQIVIDSLITAEIYGLSGEGNPTAYNTYKLYVDDVQVCQSGYEAGYDAIAPNLSSASLVYGGQISCKKTVTVKVTATLTQLGVSDNLVGSNVNNSTGNFQGAKGAFLRIQNF